MPTKKETIAKKVTPKVTPTVKNKVSAVAKSTTTALKTVPSPPSKQANLPIKRVGVIGAGLMGTGITEAALIAGFNVVLRSRTYATSQAALDKVEKSLARKVAKQLITEQKRDEALNRLKATSDLEQLANCDLVIESVLEDMETKRELFKELNTYCKTSAILASNTSTLSITDLASQVFKPERVCGIHFFNPAPSMPLIELVRALQTSDKTMEAVRYFALKCGKEPVEVKDRAGFIVNALLFPYLNNAIKLLENHVASKESIDAAMKDGCNFPMGPFALLDFIGLDTSLSILQAIYDETADPNYAPAPLLRRMVTAGKLGKKTGEGFYTYPL
ncbi:MAG: 3-hydroxyacyl-CoA dehydrogenase family protein [Actinobacteria bacterium]|nr:3-hydroxyacyl-CoA dehydrogenase family protein [Actinomycetota bacterium]MCL6105600.1 3-hydroxyacyl-CoA dehydrogenase family protein [Actinomycetota bacterium]